MAQDDVAVDRYTWSPRPSLRQGRHALLRPIAVALGVALVAYVVWTKWVVGDATKSRFLSNEDIHTYFYPMLEVAYSELHRGHLFLWNPYQLGGIPGLATLQTGQLYPLHVVYVFLPAISSLHLTTFAHLVLVLLGFLFLGRTLSLSWTASVISAFAFGFSYVPAKVFWPSAIEPLPWLPIGIAAIHRIIVRNEHRAAVLLSFGVAFPLLAGGYQIAVYIYAAFAAYTIAAFYERFSTATPLASTRRVLLALTVGVAVGLALAAPQLCPTIELARLASRTTESLTREQMLPVGRPFVNFSDVLRWMIRVPEGFEPDALGAVTATLALAGLLCAPPFIRFGCFFLVAWGVLAMWSPDFYLDLLRHVPVLGWFRLPNRAIVLAHFGQAILAGFAAHHLIARSPRSPEVLSLASAVGLLFAWLRYPGPLWYLPPLFVLSLLLMRAVLPNRLSPIAVALLLVSAQLTDLLAMTHNSIALPYSEGQRSVMTRHDELLRELAERAGVDRVLLVGASNWTLDWYEKLAMRNGLYSLGDYEPLALRSYGILSNYGGTGTTSGKESMLPFSGGVSQQFHGQKTWLPVLRSLSVRYYVLPPGAVWRPQLRRYMSEMRAIKTGVVFEDPLAWPRAYVTSEVYCAPSDLSAVDLLVRHSAGPGPFAVLEGNCQSAASSNVAGGVPEVLGAEIEEYSPNMVAIAVRTDTEAVLVLTDSFYPGWRAWVDGKEQQIERANVVARAVRLPAGAQRVVFRYRPVSFLFGVMGALVGLLGMCVFWYTLKANGDRLPGPGGLSEPNHRLSP